MKRVCIIQPILTNYCLPVFTEMSGYCQVDLIYSPSIAMPGFGEVAKPELPNVRYIVIPTFKPFGDKFGLIQWGIARYLFRERPDAVIISALPRYLSFWTTLFWGRLLRIPIHAHGHGLYKKERISAIYRVMTQAFLKMVSSYICYAPVVRQSFIAHGFPDHKLTVAHNSLVNRFPVQPQQKTGQERGILFIGRLRPGSNVELLLRVIDRLRRVDGLPLTLHVIGGGEQSQFLQRDTSGQPWIVFHSETYDQERIREISLNCFLGCYPGNAGLSVVHMISLSLPVITHDNLPGHQGPEPSFIRNGVSGLLYDHLNPEESLYQAIRSLALDPLRLGRMQQAAFDDYQCLVNPSLAARFWSILGDGSEAIERDSTIARALIQKHSAESNPKNGSSTYS